MVKLRNICIYVLLSIIIPETIANKPAKDDDSTQVVSGDKEAELLDKEYGVRYANNCEGK